MMLLLALCVLGFMLMREPEVTPTMLSERLTEFNQTFYKLFDELIELKLKDGFVAREWLFKRLLQEAQTSKKALQITGKPRIGKTATMAYMVNASRNGNMTTSEPSPGINVLGHHFCMAEQVG